jgi:CheY-like chemotaxis protein
MTNLAALGYAAVAAAGPSEALSLAAHSQPFDLLLTDVILGAGFNGRELANELVRRQPSLRVLYTSGYTEDVIVHHGRLDAGLHLLTKPYRRAELARMIRLVLDEKVVEVVEKV